MSTSGTVAQTTIDTATLIEHAFRRVRVPPSAQTPETVEIAKDCLYMLLLNLGNRGVNLWCVDKVYFGMKSGQATYTLPPGTLDVLTVSHSDPTVSVGSFSTTPLGGSVTLGSAVSAIRVGVKFSSPYSGVLTVAGTPQLIGSYQPDLYYWFDLPVSLTGDTFSVEGATAAPVSDIKVVTSSYDLPMTQWNRDTYVAINEKRKQAHPATNYFFEKKVSPQLTVWPVPDGDLNHLLLFIHRQAQDIGSLVQQIEIPQRWLDGIIWLLADRLGYELPNVDPTIAARVEQKAQQQVFEAELNETDGAPIFLSPNIGVYTR